MKLQELIKQTELDMTVEQIKAFFLGILTAERPLPFPKAIAEMLSETPEAEKVLSTELKVMWDAVQQNKSSELKGIFTENSNLKDFLTMAKDQLDFYLTALSLSGTNTESCKNEDRADLIDELEDTVMDLDEYLSFPQPTEEEGLELKAILLETWQDYLETSKLLS
jgi:hypothetical protein